MRLADPKDAEAIRAMTLYEDRDVIVLNKPHGLAVQGGSGTKRHIDGMLEALADKNGERPVLVHRLDRDTSGVLLVAKSRKMAAELGATFRSRGAKKIYGRWSRACRSRRRGGSRCFSPRARAWATSAARARRAGRISSACGSPSTATRTRSIR